jgi:phage shock protein E
LPQGVLDANMTRMNWIPYMWLFGAFIVFLLLKRVVLVSRKAAIEFLRRGAMVIDVRTPAEFQARHLPGAINIPLGDIRAEVSDRVPDQKQVLLLHCLSGGRSGIAVRALKRLGYVNVFNLGAYGRAEKILSESQK